MKVNNITKYKKSKIHVKTIGQILVDLNQVITILQKHKKYAIIQEMLADMADKKVMLETHYKEQKRIFETKGLE